MRKLFNEFGLSLLAGVTSIIIINIFINKLDFSDVLISWIMRLI